MTDPATDALARTLLVGSSRAGFPSRLGALEPWWSEAARRRPPDPDGQAALLLDGLALTGTRARIGRALPDLSARPVAGPLDLEPERPEAPPAAAALLAPLQRGGRSQALLREWLEGCAQAGFRAPSTSLPALLDLASVDRELRGAILPVLGARGRWLAGVDPRWIFASREAEEASPEALVALRERLLVADAIGPRRAAFEALRRADPEASAEALAAAWPTLPAREKLVLLDAIGDGVHPADEPLLETALDDRAKTVRAGAARLLGRLPSSSLIARMKTRLGPFLDLEHGKLEMWPPRTLPDGAERDGVVAEPPVAPLGRRYAWVEQMIAFVPPSWLTERFSASPEALLAAADRGRSGPGLRLALLSATLRHQDPAWAEALLAFRGPAEAALLAVLPGPRREALLKDRMSTASTPERLHEVLGCIPDLPRPISASFALAAVAGMERLARAGQRRAFPAYGALRRIALDAELEGSRLVDRLSGFGASLPEASPWRGAVEEAIAILRERHGILRSFEGGHP